MNKTAELLSTVFNGYGFCLLVFNLNSDGGRINYISNAERSSMIEALKEFIAKSEGRKDVQ